MYSRMSASLSAWPSLTQAIADMIWPGRAVAALERVVVDERLLHGMQRAVRLGETLDRRDLAALRPRRPASGRTARAGRRPAPCRRRTGRGRSLLRAGQSEMLAQHIEQRGADIEGEPVVVTVDIQVGIDGLAA